MADPPAGVGLERVGDTRRLVAAALRATGDPRQQVRVPGPVGAGAAPEPDEDLRLEESVHVVLAHHVLELRRGRPGDADAGMVDEPLADRKLVGGRLDGVPPGAPSRGPMPLRRRIAGEA